MRVLGQRYRLGDVLGRGGMGVVHRATDEELERPVAVKLMAADENDRSRQAFLKEAKRTAGLRHPNIVEVFDVGKEGDDAFLVMELLEGEPLGSRLERPPLLSIEESVALAAEVCDALAFAHARGVVHRDVKPANVFLAKEPDGFRVKLLDFGVAKRIDGSTASETEGWAGTLGYMAPEQIREARVDGRTDLYALGLVLYELLSGEKTFDADNAASLVHQHLMKAPVPIRERAPARGVRYALDAFVLRLLSKEPNDRFPDALAAKAALLEAADPGKPDVVATPAVVELPFLDRTRMIDDDEDGPGPELALDLDRRPPPSPTKDDGARRIAIASAGLPVPVVHAPITPAPPVAPWIASLARVPAVVSKRVALYSAIALVLNLLFFHLSIATVLLGLLAAGGALAYWGANRAGRA